MNNSNPENPADNDEPVAAAPAPAPAPVPNPGLDARRRLRELLSVPERDRSDEQWDEIIELEIQLAPGNRISGNEPHGGTPGRSQNTQGKPGGGQKKHRPRPGGGGGGQQQRRPRQNKPQGGGGNPA